MIHKAHTQPNVTLGEAAVDGLLAGGAAGVAMTLYLLIAEWVGGVEPATVLGRFDPSGSGSPVAGALAHLAVAAVYGALFGVVARGLARLWTRVPIWLGGVAYGLILWGLALAAVLPALATSLRAILPLHFAIAHSLYGLALGLWLARRVAKSER